jgi:hypothetical protein
MTMDSHRRHPELLRRSLQMRKALPIAGHEKNCMKQRLLKMSVSIYRANLNLLVDWANIDHSRFRDL